MVRRIRIQHTLTTTLNCDRASLQELGQRDNPLPPVSFLARRRIPNRMGFCASPEQAFFRVSQQLLFSRSGDGHCSYS